MDSGFPPFGLPPFSTTDGNKTVAFPEMASRMGSGIFVIPLIAILESVSIAKAFGKLAKFFLNYEHCDIIIYEG